MKMRPKAGKESHVTQFIIPPEIDPNEYNPHPVVKKMHTFACELMNEYAEGTLDKAGVVQKKMQYMQKQNEPTAASGAM